VSIRSALVARAAPGSESGRAGDLRLYELANVTFMSRIAEVEPHGDGAEILASYLL